MYFQCTLANTILPSCAAYSHCNWNGPQPFSAKPEVGSDSLLKDFIDVIVSYLIDLWMNAHTLSHACCFAQKAEFLAPVRVVLVYRT